MRGAGRPVALLLLAGLPAACHASSGRGTAAERAEPARTFCVALRPRPDSTLVELRASVRVDPDESKLPARFAEQTAGIVAVRFLELSGTTPTSVATRDVRFTLNRYGAVRSVRALGDVVSPGDSVLIEAVRSAARLRLFDDFPGTLREDSAVVTMRLSSSLRFGVRLSADGRDVETPVRRLPNRSGPAYPLVAAQLGVGDSVLVQFVVEENGRADLATMRVLRGRWKEFALAAREAMARQRYQPAITGGCPVRQLVQTPFDFRIE